MDTTPFVVIVDIHLKAEAIDEYLEMVKPVHDAMSGEATYVNTVLHQSAEDPSHIMIYETWLDEADFRRNQLVRPYRKSYEARLPELVTRPRQVTYYKPLRGNFIFQSGPMHGVKK